MCERVPWTPRCVNTALKLDVALLQSRMEFPGHGKDSAVASVETTARSLSPFGVNGCVQSCISMILLPMFVLVHLCWASDNMDSVEHSSRNLPRGHVHARRW